MWEQAPSCNSIGWEYRKFVVYNAQLVVSGVPESNCNMHHSHNFLEDLNA